MTTMMTTRLFSVFRRNKNKYCWNRARECKKLIEKLWDELKIQKSVKNGIIRQSCADIAEQLKSGKDDDDDDAFGFDGQILKLYQEMCRVSAYQQLDHFSVCVYKHLPHIKKESELELPSEVNEALSSLIYGGTKCQDLYRLRLLQPLLHDICGCEYFLINSKLLSGNSVNLQMVEDLQVNSIPDDVERRLVRIIAEDHGIDIGKCSDRVKALAAYDDGMARKIDSNVSSAGRGSSFSSSFDDDDDQSFTSSDSDSHSCGRVIEEEEEESIAVGSSHPENSLPKTNSDDGTLETDEDDDQKRADFMNYWGGVLSSEEDELSDGDEESRPSKTRVEDLEIRLERLWRRRQWTKM